MIGLLRAFTDELLIIFFYFAQKKNYVQLREWISSQLITIELR